MVDAVNNNRDAVYTGIGAGVGAVAGGAYGGWLSKPLLSKDAPSDAFVRRYYDNSAKDAAEAAKKAFKESFGEKDVDDLKDELKTNPKKYGIEFAPGADDNAKNAKIDEYAKDLDKNGLFAKMEKAVGENAIAGKKSGKELTNLKKAFDKLGDNPDANAVKDFVKKHAEILGENADGTSNITTKSALETKVNSVLTELNGKAAELKGFINDKKLDLSNASDVIKKAAKDTKLWAGAKWAAIGAAVIGVCSYIGAKMTAPKAEAPAEENV